MISKVISLQATFQAKRSTLERRVVMRYACNQEIACFVLPTYERVWAQIRDISETGVGLVTKRQVAKGTALLIRMERIVRPVSLAIPAHVVHSTRVSNGSWLTGCEFDTPAPGPLP